MDIVQEILTTFNDDPELFIKIITGDKSWVYGYDIETKAHSSQRKRPEETRPKKPFQVRSNVKVLLTIFFDCNGVQHHEFLPQGHTVNTECYLEVMRRLVFARSVMRRSIRQKHTELWKNESKILYYHNKPAHTSMLVREFFAKNQIIIITQPPYSPDLAPPLTFFSSQN